MDLTFCFMRFSNAMKISNMWLLLYGCCKTNFFDHSSLVLLLDIFVHVIENGVPVHTLQTIIPHSQSMITIGYDTIAPSLTVKNLGVVFDNNLTLTPHISSHCKSAFF